MTKERIAAMRDAVKSLCKKVNPNYETTADLMREVLTLEDYEPFPLEGLPLGECSLPPPLQLRPPQSKAAISGATSEAGVLSRERTKEETSISTSSQSRPLKAPLSHQIPPFSLQDKLPSTVVWSNGIEECASDFRGRYMVASRDIKPGEILIVEKAFVTVIADKHTKVYCEACRAYPEAGTNFKKCPSCKSVVWCCERCRVGSLLEFHRYECPVKAQLMPLKTDHYFLAMRMVIRGWKNTIEKYVKGVSIGESLKVADEFTLLENRSKLSFEKIIDAAVMGKVFLWILKLAGFVNQLQAKIRQEYGADFLDNESLDHFLATTLLSHWIRIQCNAFQHNFMQVIKQKPSHFQKEATIEPYKPIGFGVLVSLKIAQINHSCRPNCDYYFVDDTQIVRTIDHIKKGEEIFITYERIARSMIEKEDRSPHVAKNYGFACFCAYCNTPGIDFCDLYALEDLVDASDKQLIESQMEETSQLMFRSKVEEALAGYFQLKQVCIEKSMFWTASEIDERIDDCFGLLGTKIFVVL